MKLRWTIVSAVTILTLTGAVVASVILYWIRIQGNPIRCIYAEPGCSLAVSTYALAGATALLVGGSLVAALLTIQQFEHDRSAFLSVQRCRRETACKFTETVAYLAHDVDVFRFEKPDGWDPMDWGVTYVDCASVGKGPLVAAELQIEIRPATDGPRASVNLPIGDLPPGERIHLRLYFGSPFQTRDVTLSKVRHDGLSPQLRFFASNTKLFIKYEGMSQQQIFALPQEDRPEGAVQSALAALGTALRRLRSATAPGPATVAPPAAPPPMGAPIRPNLAPPAGPRTTGGRSG